MKRLLTGLLLLAAACRQDMHDQPRYDAFEKSHFFADGRSVRPRVEGTVPRGALEYDEHLEDGRVLGEVAETFPMPLSTELLERGRERYQIFCAICHDTAGYGQGMAVLRGMKQPSSFHVDRLRQAPPGYYFDVITRGFGAMFDYADRINPSDRWAIVAYIRALQLSQNTPLSALSADERARLERSE